MISELSQSAEYDKRVANISLFIYIGSPWLHPNSRQAPGSSRQLPGSSRQSPSHIYIYIYIYIMYEEASGVPGESRWWTSNILYCLKTCENSHLQLHYATLLQHKVGYRLRQETDWYTEMTDWQCPSGKCKLPNWQLVIICCQRYTPYFVHINLFANIFRIYYI